MKSNQNNRPISVFPAGHGHNKISVIIRGKEYSTVTSNTLATDRLRNEEYRRDRRMSCARAYEALYDEIKSANNLK